MKQQQGVKAILLMGGQGKRLGSELPKQFHRLSGKKIYLQTLEKFLESDLFEEILLVSPLQWRGQIEQDLEEFRESKAKIRIIPGGETRQDSSFKGILACGPETRYVVIHDAVRPFVSYEILLANVMGAMDYGAIDTCIPSADTLVFAPSGAQITEIPPRANYLRGQTPQSFSYEIILSAHKRANHLHIQNATDDCQLVLDMGKRVQVVPGSEHNIKITTELDLYLAEQLLRIHQRSISRKDPTQRDLEGKRYAITGGTGGIGQAISTLLKEEGATPIIISKRSPDYAADLTSYENVQTIFERINKEHGPIDGLINSIGLFKVKEVNQLQPQEIEEMIAVNLTALIFCCKSALIKEGGHIVNIASSSYSRGRKTFSVYSSAKAAVVNFTQALAEERPRIKINAVVPQRTNTPMRSTNFPDENPETLLHPEKVAKTIIALLKEQLITGAIIEVKKEDP